MLLSLAFGTHIAMLYHYYCLIKCLFSGLAHQAAHLFAVARQILAHLLGCVYVGGRIRIGRVGAQKTDNRHKLRE